MKLRRQVIQPMHGWLYYPMRAMASDLFWSRDRKVGGRAVVGEDDRCTSQVKIPVYVLYDGVWGTLWVEVGR